MHPKLLKVFATIPGATKGETRTLVVEAEVEVPDNLEEAIQDDGKGLVYETYMTGRLMRERTVIRRELLAQEAPKLAPRESRAERVVLRGTHEGHQEAEHQPAEPGRRVANARR